MSAHEHDVPDITVTNDPPAYVGGGAISDSAWEAWQTALSTELATMTPEQRHQWTR